MPLRTNLVRNPSFETNATGWFADQSTISRSTARASLGTASLLVTATLGAGTGFQTQTASGTSGMPVTASTVYRVQGSMWTANSGTGQIWVLFYNSSGTVINPISAAVSQSLTVNAWTTLSTTVTSPATAAYAEVRFIITSAAISGHSFNLDQVHFELESTWTGSYFDGSYDKNDAYWHAWTGTAHGSTSTQNDALGNRVNLLSNPGFGLNTTGWSATSWGGGTPAISRSDSVYVGNWPGSLELTGNATTATDRPGALSPQIFVRPGVQYTLSASVRHTGTARDVTLWINWYDSAGSSISSHSANVGQDLAGFTTESTSATAPAGVFYARAEIVFGTGTVGLGEIHRIDNVIFEASSTYVDYFDGMSFDAAGVHEYVWSGSYHNSVSYRRPLQQRTNIIVNPSFETNTTGWTSIYGSPTLTRSSAQAKSGSFSLAVTGSNSAPNMAPMYSNYITWQADRWLSVQMSVYAAVVSGRSWYMGAAWYNSSFQLLGTSYTSLDNLTANTWSTVSNRIIRYSTYSSATYMRPYIEMYLGSTVSSSETFYIDEIIAEWSNGTVAYFDGSTPDATPWDYAWTGTAHASSSTATRIWSGSATGTYHLAGSATGEYPLYAPTGIVSTPVSGTQIDLTWDAVANAGWYDIERDGITVGHTTSTSYSDTGLTPLTTYNYRIRAGRY